MLGIKIKHILYLVVLEVNVGGWENMFINMGKTCIFEI